MQPNNTEKLLTLAELAKRLDVGQAKARSMVRGGEIPCFRIGNQLRFDWLEVVNALRAPKSGAVA